MYHRRRDLVSKRSGSVGASWVACDSMGGEAELPTAPRRAHTGARPWAWDVDAWDSGLCPTVCNWAVSYTRYFMEKLELSFISLWWRLLGFFYLLLFNLSFCFIRQSLILYSSLTLLFFLLSASSLLLLFPEMSHQRWAAIAVLATVPLCCWLCDTVGPVWMLIYHFGFKNL